jgi:hypothetical protein
MPVAATLRSCIVPTRRVYPCLLRMITSTNSHYFPTQHQLIALGANAELRKVTINFVISVRPSSWKNLPPTGRIFMKYDT